MTNKDAIYYLQYLRHDVPADSPYDIALVTAINALSSGNEHKKVKIKCDAQECKRQAIKWIKQEVKD